jgi:hypothetical protein
MGTQRSGRKRPFLHIPGVECTILVWSDLESLIYAGGPPQGRVGLDVALVKSVHNDVQCHKESFESA